MTTTALPPHLQAYVPPNPQEAMRLVALPADALLAQATQLREAAFGRQIDLCVIINARSGNCSMDCRFCSQSRHNSTGVATFPLLSAAQLRERLLELGTLPVHHMGIVTSGPALDGEELTRLCRVLADLPATLRRRVCASLGRLRPQALSGLKGAGLQRYHHNLETARSYYPAVCSTQTWEQRRDTVLAAQQAGLEICAGGLFGLGESWEQRIDFAFSLKALGIRHVPINFLHPHPRTPLARQPLLAAAEALRIIAIFRHILPYATLRICGGRPETLGSRQVEIFAAGANALMTGDYLTTQGQSLAHDLAMIHDNGLTIHASSASRNVF